MNQVREEKVRVQAQLEKLATPNLNEGRSTITTLLELLGDAMRLYRTSGEAGRKVLNQAFFTRIYINETDGVPFVASNEPTDIIRPLIEAQRAAGMPTQHVHGGTAQPDSTAATITPSLLLASALAGGGSHKSDMVAPTGFEPALPP